MRGVMFIGGEGPAPEALRKIARGADLLAAADSGLIACEGAGLRPDWVLGDMDSLDDPLRLEKYRPEKVLRYSHDKDFTDTELALNLLIENGCDEIWLAGGGNGRTDHLLAIYSLFQRQTPPDRWFTADEEIYCLRDGHTLNEHMFIGAARKSPFEWVSVFPLGEGPWEAESAGLKWPLNDLPWNKGFFGISNEAKTGTFNIRSVRGRFLVIVGLTQITVL